MRISVYRLWPLLFVSVLGCDSSPSTAPSSTSEAALDFDGEVDVARCVDDVNVVILPRGVGGSAGDRDAPFTLKLHRVHLGPDTVLPPHIMNRVHPVRVVQNPLGKGGLAAIDMCGDPNIADRCEVLNHCRLPFQTRCAPSYVISQRTLRRRSQAKDMEAGMCRGRSPNRFMLP